MEIRCQIIFIKHRFWKIYELETFGTRKRILRTKLEGCSCDRKRPVVFWTFPTFVCIANQLWAATKIVHGKKIQGNVWKVQNTTGRFLAQLHPSNFVPKILFLVPEVSNSWIFQMFYEKYLTSDFHTNTVISSLFAYPSKWRRKPW